MERTRRQRSADTRARILAAAKRLFSEDGYDRTTIRAVAAEATIDPSMVMRYFRSKKGLFTAAARFDLGLPDLSHLPRRKLGEAMVDYFLKRWEGELNGKDLQILLRSAATHDSAAKRMYDIFQHQLVPFIRQYCGTQRAEECAALVATQMLGLGYIRYVLKFSEVTNLSHAVIRRRIGATIQAYLDMR